MDSTVLEIDTSEAQIVDLTGEAATFCRGRPDGLLNVFAPHATAGVALMETGSGSEADLLEALGRVLPRDGRYRQFFEQYVEATGTRGAFESDRSSRA